MRKPYKVRSLDSSGSSFSKIFPLIAVGLPILTIIFAIAIRQLTVTKKTLESDSLVATENTVSTVDEEDEEETTIAPQSAEQLEPSTASSFTGRLYNVDRVVDGDTIVADGAKVRLIGVNTPETVHPSKPQECFGVEASNYMKALLTSRQVMLEPDDSQDNVDKYGRYLRYVILDGENVNMKLIKDGYAYEYTYNVPYKYQTEFKAAQKYADENNLGLWSPDTCNGQK